MSNGTVPAIADLLRSASPSNYRLHPVDGDSMEPGLRGGLDYALIQPVDTFSVDGVYLIAHGTGLDLYRVAQLPKGDLYMGKDNPRYSAYVVPRDLFDGAVCGLVIADVSMKLTPAQASALAQKEV